MLFTASPAAVDLVRRRGGRVYVWGDGRVRVATERPRVVAFEPFSGGDFELYFDRTLPPPARLHVSVSRFPGRRLAVRGEGEGWAPSRAVDVFWRGIAVQHLAGVTGGGNGRG